MIRVITGMLVMAIAVANTSTKDSGVAEGPQKSCSWISARKPSPARNGRTMPVAVIQATGRASSRLNADRISAPAQNSSSSSPSCATALRMTGVAPSAGTARRPRRAPGRRARWAQEDAADDLADDPGCRMDAKSPPTRWAATSSAASASRMWATSVVESFMILSAGSPAYVCPGAGQ